MPAPFHSTPFRNTLRLAALAAVMLPAAAQQQRESLPVDLPKGPAKPGFDIQRFSNVGNGWFKTFYVEQSLSLQQALAENKIANETRLLVLQTAAGKLALIVDQMAYHHIAQGTEGGKTWMATF